MQLANKNKTLIVVTGPTGSGKTDLAIKLALHYGCHILSADSRQLYREIPIGTAAPTAEQLALVPHHFVGTLSLEDYYSAAQYEEDVMRLLPQLWEENDYVVMCGGSMMYVDAVTKGIDELPTISPEIREKAMAIYQEGGIELLRSTLLALDPEYYQQVDLNNHKRLVHAIEITMHACLHCYLYGMNQSQTIGACHRDNIASRCALFIIAHRTSKRATISHSKDVVRF